MSWTALAIVTVLLLLTVVALIYQFWPRTEDGDFMSPEEVEEFLDKFPKPQSRSKHLMVVIFATIAMIAVALTKRDPDFNAGE